MDPNSTQTEPDDENPPPNSTAINSNTANLSDGQSQSQPHQHQHQQSGILLPDYFHDPNPNNRLLNDANLILNRRINCNQKIKKNLELICEDKISRYKLEEVHCSLPSSIKSTFIMTFSPDGRKVASTHGDHRIYICDLNTGKLLDTLDGHSKTPWCLAWHPINREILASGCLAGEVRVWDLRSKACETWNSENNTIITSLDFHPKERILVIASANDIHFWDWSESRPFAKTTTTHDKEKVKFVEFDPSGTKLVTGISNLPKYAGYSSDSLQTRILDSYLTQGNLDQLPTENMTQNSEITSPLSGALNTNDTFNDRNLYQSVPNRRQPIGSTNNNEPDAYRSTVTLSRVASLYRQLEALEDSMRHTSFSPYIDPRPIGSAPVEMSSRQSNSEPANNNNTNEGEGADRISTDNPPDIEQPSSQVGRSERPPIASEPFVVSFDESLENLQLLPLTVDGQNINLATLIEQYPIDLPHQLHYVMQFESINQVNQNFIRISKLMSSVRLYRQVVHQILSSSAGQGHYQPNQVLTAQSASPRSSRLGSNLPIVFRNFPMGSSLDANNRLARSSDPIMAIQFRNSARNVPLVTICKIDLLSARSVCISRSQQLVEQALSSFRSSALGQHSADATFYSLLNQLHQSLTNINHAPLTTSNVHIHISSLRSLINTLLTTLSSLTNTQEEGLRQVRLIHDIAHSLTGRSWNIPLGANLDDVRLDVIHTLCIVDLTLHLTRQIQLLQMQRLSAMARIEESRRANISGGSTSAQTSTSDRATEQTETVQGPSTSQMSPTTNTITTSSSLSSKRKDLEAATSLDDASKRRRVETERVGSDIEMIEAHNSRLTENIESPNINSNSPVLAVNVNNQISSPVSNGLSGLTDAAPGDRLIFLNGAQPTLDQGLQRFLVATAASSVNNSHILVRIYHRLHGHLLLSNMPPNSVLEQPNASLDRPNPPLESRRRALSQDNSAAAGPGQESPPRADNPRGPRQFQVNFTPTSGNTVNSNAAAANAAAPQESLARHFHVYQGRSAGQHLWFNQWTIPLPVSNLNFRLQCWDFSASALPNIKDSQSNIVTQKCRIHNDASIDISSDGTLVACLVPRDDVACLPSFDLKVFSLRTIDFGVCYYQLPHGPNAVSVSLSPTASHAVVGLATNKFISSDPNEDDLTIAKVCKLKGKQPFGFVRDVKIKRDDSSLSLNAIRWMERGIVYNVGPQHHQRYTARMRNRAV